jgi:Leucine-rich repeat (LRR) protein
LEIIVDQLRS